MNTLKRTLALLSVLALASASFVGCGDDKKSSSGSTSTTSATSADSNKETSGESKKEEAKITLPDTGDKLTVVTWTVNDIEPQFELFCKAKGYEKDKDIAYALVGSSGTEAMNGYETYFLGDGDCDVYAAEAGWILQFINNDKFAAPLSDVGITKDDFANAYGYTVAIGTNKDGVLKGASYQAAPGGYAYRADLAEEYLGVKSPKEMQKKVDTWDNFVASAKTVLEKSGDKKTAIAATMHDIWHVYQSNRTKAWVDKDGKLDLENCENYLTMIKDMYDKGYVTKQGQWDKSWYALGNDGSTMGYFFSTWCLTNSETGQLMQAEGGTSGAAYGKYNICQGPTKYFWGGTWYVVSPECDNGTKANEFIKYFTVEEEGMKAYVEKTGDFTNNKKVMKDIIDAKSNKNPLFKDGQDQFAVLTDIADGINLDGIITEYDQNCKDAFNEAVTEYVVDGKTKSVADAIESFKDKLVAKDDSIKVD